MEHDIATFTICIEATEAAATIDYLTYQLARKQKERIGSVSTVLRVYRYELLF